MSYNVCNEDDSPAPRVGCSCRECYRARELSLDPRLVALVSFNITSTPARLVVLQCLQHYLAGRVEWALLHTEIITKLVELSDASFQRELDAASLTTKMPTP